MAWGKDDLALVKASLHSWKADMLEAGRAQLAEALPESDETDRDWALCMVLSRSFTSGKGSSVMLPYIDLLNHEASAAGRGRKGASVYQASHPDRMVVVAARDIAAGEELTWEYLAAPSRARLLTSFGFGSARDAPAASLAAKDLPDRDWAWLAKQGCGRVARTDLETDAHGKVGSAEVREALRCIRLRLYTPEEAVWAVRTGFIDAAWESTSPSPTPPATCTDLPGASGGSWFDKDGDGCAEWGANGWCKSNAADVFPEGVPKEKCCACGGGDRTSQQSGGGGDPASDDALRASALAKDLRIVMNTGQMCEVRVPPHRGV